MHSTIIVVCIYEDAHSYTYKGFTMLVNTLCQKASSRLDTMQSREAVISFLDRLESEIIETPYGDVIYEHAYEYAQAIVLPRFTK